MHFSFQDFVFFVYQRERITISNKERNRLYNILERHSTGTMLQGGCVTLPYERIINEEANVNSSHIRKRQRGKQADLF